MDNIEGLAEEAYGHFTAAVLTFTQNGDAARALALLDELEAAYVPRFLALGARDRARNVRIWAADGRRVVAYDGGASLDRCEILLARRLALADGPDPYDRALTIGAFCGHAARAGEPERAEGYMVPLVESLEYALARDPSDEVMAALEHARAVLALVRAARR